MRRKKRYSKTKKDNTNWLESEKPSGSDVEAGKSQKLKSKLTKVTRKGIISSTSVTIKKLKAPVKKKNKKTNPISLRNESFDVVKRKLDEGLNVNLSKSEEDPCEEEKEIRFDSTGSRLRDALENGLLDTNKNESNSRSPVNAAYSSDD